MPESRDHHNGATEANGSQPSPSRRLDTAAARALAGFASQTVVLTAVLFYFGWARVRATYAYFGVDVSVLNFSAADYVLRSVSTAFPLLVAMGLLTVGATLIHDQSRSALLGNSALAARLVRVLSAVGWGLVVAGFILALAITGPGGSALPGPAAMLAGLTIVVYALILNDRYVGRNQSRLIVIVVGLLTLALLWTVTAYADFVGVQVAKELQAALPTAPNVTVYSSSDLSLAGPGVTEFTMTSHSVAYRFRYSGLRLLVSSGDRYFLLPAKWHPGTGSVIVLPVTPPGLLTRVQFQVRAP